MLDLIRSFTKDRLRVGIAAVMFYAAFQIFADILSLKVTTMFGLTFGAVFFVYPLTFTFRDLIHKTLGVKAARIVIVSALAINVVMLLIFEVYLRMPVVAYDEFQVMVQDASSLVFGSIWRIVLASIIAEFISEMLDTEIYQRFVNKFGQKHQWGRVLFSNAIAGPIDVIIFNTIAFAGLFSTQLLVNLSKTEIFIRILMAVVSIPLIYLAPQFDELKGKVKNTLSLD